MQRYENGQTVPSGVYLSPRHFDLRIISGDQGVLTGPDGATYLRLPIVMAIVLAPVIGGLFAVAFPIVIFTVLGGAFALWIRSAFKPVSAGTPARSGVYVGLNRLAAHCIGADGETLPGAPGARYLRIPTSLVVLASPLIGGLYVVIFPFILGAAIITVLGRLLAQPVVRLWDENANLARLRWEPSMSYLQKNQEKQADEKTEGDTENAELDPELAELEDEVEKRRQDEQAEPKGGSSK